MQGAHLKLTVLLILALLATVAFATPDDPVLGTHPGEKSAPTIVHGGGDGREGGETIEGAFPIAGLPFNDTGNTCDNGNDYDESCPYEGSTSPDVVYSYQSINDQYVDIDLCGSLYDTKVYVYDSSGGENIACNDDYYFDEICGEYVSYIGMLELSAGETYYIVIDGFGGDCGEYLLLVEEGPIGEHLECLPIGVPEGEPELHDDYVDEFNGGCNSTPPVFQELPGDSSNSIFFCGVAGWYLFEGSTYRDTDWFDVIAAADQIVCTCYAESESDFYVLDIPDCNSTTVLQSVTVRQLDPQDLVIETTPGQIVHLWAGSTNFTNPGDVVGNMYNYHMEIEGIADQTAVEAATWGGVKSLYR